jgi:hypothetical protein
MARASGTSPVYLVDLVCFVYLVDLVHLVSFVEPKNQINQTDQTNQTTVFLRWWNFSSILLNQIRLRNSTDRGGSVTASEWGIPWEGTALV